MSRVFNSSGDFLFYVCEQDIIRSISCNILVRVIMKINVILRKYIHISKLYDFLEECVFLQ